MGRREISSVPVARAYGWRVVEVTVPQALEANVVKALCSADLAERFALEQERATLWGAQLQASALVSDVIGCLWEYDSVFPTSRALLADMRDSGWACRGDSRYRGIRVAGTSFQVDVFTVKETAWTAQAFEIAVRHVLMGDLVGATWPKKAYTEKFHAPTLDALAQHEAVPAFRVLLGAIEHRVRWRGPMRGLPMEVWRTPHLDVGRHAALETLRAIAGARGSKERAQPERRKYGAVDREALDRRAEEQAEGAALAQAETGPDDS